MISDDQKSLVVYRLEKSVQTLIDAGQLYKSESFGSSVNRIYYALFYAVSALLLCRGLSTSKHTGIKSFLHKEFIKTGVIEHRWGAFYTEMFNNRQEGDYEDFVSFEKKDVERWLTLADEFIKVLKQSIERYLT